MWWSEQDDAAAGADRAGARALIELAGIESHAADEIVSAVRSYCVVRHGTDQLPRDYFNFLLARAGTRLAEKKSGLSEPEAVCRILEPVADDRMFVRALVNAEDPAELAEAYRRKLVGMATSDLAAGRFLLTLSLHKIAIDVARELPMAWAPVLHRAARWVGCWRAGNPELAMVKIIPHRAWFKAWPEAREILDGSIRREEAARKLEPAELVCA